MPDTTKVILNIVKIKTEYLVYINKRLIEVKISWKIRYHFCPKIIVGPFNGTLNWSLYKLLYWNNIISLFKIVA